MPTEQRALAASDPRPQRALRMGAGTALSVAVSYGMALPIPMMAPVLAAFLLVMRNRPLSFKEGLGLTMVVAVTTGIGLLLGPVLHYFSLSGVAIVGLCLFLAFRRAMLGGNNLVTTFLAAGLTMISAASTVDFSLGALVISALVQGLLVAMPVLAVCHWLFPDPMTAPAPPPPPVLPKTDAARLALRATLVVMPAFLLTLTDPMGYLPVMMKAVSIGRQSCTTTARSAARELIGSTLLGGVMAMLFWCALGAFVNLWMYCLWMLLFGLWTGRKLYGLHVGRQSPAFWLNTMVTLIILLGQSVEDSVLGKDVWTAFAVRMALFVAVALYAYAMVVIFDRSAT